jgi:predicted AlkP superfamily phosphohydrolase/phosphomutase
MSPARAASGIPVRWILLALLAALLWPEAAAAAYDWTGVGPAATSLFLVLFLASSYVFLALLVRPLGRLRRALGERRSYRNARFKRVIVVGLDGMDPELATRWMRQGKLPHLARLAKTGTFRPLATTHPPVSPVTWSTFLTGVNPGKHNIFDVLTRDRHTYRPSVPTACVLRPRRGLFSRIRQQPPEVKPLRKSKPFWHHLGDAGIFSSVLCVPATFPPEPFAGALLSGASVPDLRGTQGTSFMFSSREGSGGRQEGHLVLPLSQENEDWGGELPGPENPFSKDEAADLTLPFRLRPETTNSGATRYRAVMEIDGRRIPLRLGRLSGWIPLQFRGGWGVRVQGICRMCLKSLQPDVELYVTPVQIDPRSPALSISHPADFSVSLGNLYGPFATLGLAEDIGAPDDGALDEAVFLKQCYQFQAERERMFFDALEKTRCGLCIGVFDIMDRVQHMFWRRLEPPPGVVEPPEASPIESLYQRMDALAGRVMDSAGPETLVLFLSDHGFKTLRYIFNLNAWLHHHGYLALVSGSTVSEERFRQVDWHHTRAYGLGFNSLYLNLAGRERHGTVQPGEEADALLLELREKLRGIRDPDTGHAAISEVFDTREVYLGPYCENAPDMLIGYAPGYGPAREAVNGAVMGEIFEDNARAWSGGHALAPRDVPGVLFANRVIRGEAHSIADVAPTILHLFGLPVPRYMDGRPWTVRTEPPPVRAPGPSPGPL